MTGAHSKAVQAVMRHQTITLTMDTYGHLFPGQEADAMARMWSMLTEAGDSLPPEALRATGTNDLPIDAPQGVQRMTQRAERERGRARAMTTTKATRKRKRPSPYKLRTWAMNCEPMRTIAKVLPEGLEPSTY